MNITLQEHLTVTNGLKMEKQLLARMVQEKRAALDELAKYYDTEIAKCQQAISSAQTSAGRLEMQLQTIALVAMGKGGEVKLADEHPSLVLVRSLYADYQKLNNQRKPRGARK